MLRRANSSSRAADASGEGGIGAGSGLTRDSVEDARLVLTDGTQTHITMHLIEGSKDQIKRMLMQSIDAFFELNVFMPGESIPNSDAQFGLRALNGMIGSWATQPLTIPATARHVLS